MGYPIEKKLVIAVASSGLFDLSESDAVFREKGPVAYRAFQQQHLDQVLRPGFAFTFIERLLRINSRFPDEMPVEVVLLSRNSAFTGKRVFRSIAHYGLPITRAAFVEGENPFPYIPAFNAALFLSANEADVTQALAAGYPAGYLLPGARAAEEDCRDELRIAFDFDGVIADDEAEQVFQNTSLEAFHRHEQSQAQVPHRPGPLAELFRRLAQLQQLEDRAVAQDHDYRRLLRIAIITARNAPAHERMLTTLEHWGVSAQQTFFLGGMDKGRVLRVFQPHIFFDDQRQHLTLEDYAGAMAHIPFGIAARR